MSGTDDRGSAIGPCSVRSSVQSVVDSSGLTADSFFRITAAKPIRDSTPSACRETDCVNSIEALALNDQSHPERPPRDDGMQTKGPRPRTTRRPRGEDVEMPLVSVWVRRGP